MAKKETAPARTTLEGVNESLTGAAQTLEQNKKIIYWVVGALLGLVVIGAGYYYLIHKPAKEKAVEAVGLADLKILQGDTANALKDYEAYAGDFNRAHYSAATILYTQGKYKEAVAHLEDYKAEGALVGPAALSLKGDCYVNLKDYDKAVSAYDEAIKQADGNEMYAPAFMVKKATVLHEQKKYADEAAVYQDIKDNYPNYSNAFRFNVDKYLERANALAGK